MARTTFRRLTRQEEIRTTANVSTMPMQKARITFWGLVAKTMRKSFAPAGEALAQEADHHPADPDAGDAAHGARHERVERALEGEGADEVGALHPDGARYAELVLALGGEHHEDQEDEEHPGRHRELPEEDEEGREDLSLAVGPVYRRPSSRDPLRGRWTRGRA